MSGIDPDKEIWAVPSATDWIFGINVGPSIMVNVHSRATCSSHYCVIHNPSEHPLRGWPLRWRGDRKIFERICEHNVAHPDPDSVAYEIDRGREWQADHECDGCCQGIQDG